MVAASMVMEPVEMVDILAALADCPPYDIGRLMRLKAQAAAVLKRDEARPPPTPREADALDALRKLGGVHRRLVSTTAVALELMVDESWAYRLLARLRQKGYVERVGSHRRGGWCVRVSGVGW